jgi:hypothetical protein
MKAPRTLQIQEQVQIRQQERQSQTTISGSPTSGKVLSGHVGNIVCKCPLYFCSAEVVDKVEDDVEALVDVSVQQEITPLIPSRKVISTDYQGLCDLIFFIIFMRIYKKVIKTLNASLIISP